jgi:hypothetical protein
VLAGREEPELMRRRRRGQTSATQREVVAGAHGVHADAAQVSEIADRRVPTCLDDRARGLRPDAGNAEQQLQRRARDLQREALGMGQRPGRLGIVLERQVASRLERQLLDAEPVLAQQVLGLVEP